MDGGKATALTAHNDCTIWEFDFDRETPELPRDHAFPPLICIPHGGHRCRDSTAMATRRAGDEICVWHPRLKPLLTLLDLEITRGLTPVADRLRRASTWARPVYRVPDFHPM